ncbi:MAG TPA: DegT/DnrJ/EryC1/StrS family aminotransferase, partial [Candidatus Nitrosotenuis sp.]|nr:DegT/DnrJ/EryC1/StrS family aminotransferase [Candidatus Nitrosotenuis sp.]
MAREPAIPRFSLALQAGDLAWAVSHLRRGDPGALARFEQEFASWLGVRRAFFLPSARSGIYLVFKELGLAPGTRVLVPAQTHPSVPAMVLAAGLVPRIVDVSEGTWCMEPPNIPPEAWEGVGAVMATHLYGCPARVAELADECQRRGAVLLEDCAQGLGAEVEGGRRAGATGRASFFSFTLTKNFTTLGGGMVAFQDEELAERVGRALAGLGQD